MVETMVKALGAYGPQYLLLGLVVVALWKSGALKEILKRTEGNEKYVLKTDCHFHIDDLKKEIADTRTDLKEHINRVDEKVNILLFSENNKIKG